LGRRRAGEHHWRGRRLHSEDGNHHVTGGRSHFSDKVLVREADGWDLEGVGWFALDFAAGRHHQGVGWGHCKTAGICRRWRGHWARVEHLYPHRLFLIYMLLAVVSARGKKGCRRRGGDGRWDFFDGRQAFPIFNHGDLEENCGWMLQR